MAGLDRRQAFRQDQIPEKPLLGKRTSPDQHQEARCSLSLAWDPGLVSSLAGGTCLANHSTGMITESSDCHSNSKDQSRTVM